jgi:hypothetical protein
MDARINNAISIEKRVAGTSGRYVSRIDGVDGEANSFSPFEVHR